MRVNFKNIEYLQNGNAKQKAVYESLRRNSIMKKLEGYDPILVGTIPIDIDIENSDLDIICYCSNLEQFNADLKVKFSKEKNFSISSKIIHNEKSIIARFELDKFDFEIFGQNVPTEKQNAYCHMIKEYQILQNHNSDFKRSIKNLKQKGIKTEPAFAELLGIKGDPYCELLKY